MQPMLVTGCTGTLGRLVVPRPCEAGCNGGVLSRRGHSPGDGVAFVTGDLTTSERIDAAAARVGTALHPAGSVKAPRSLEQIGQQ